MLYREIMISQKITDPYFTNQDDSWNVTVTVGFDHEITCFSMTFFGTLKCLYFRILEMRIERMMAILYTPQKFFIEPENDGFEF